MYRRGATGTSPFELMNFHYVYVLKSFNHDFLYVGFTERTPELRLQEHNNQEEKSTKYYAPFELIHYEAYKNIKDAKRRERYFKTTKGRAVLKNMLKAFLSA